MSKKLEKEFKKGHVYILTGKCISIVFTSPQHPLPPAGSRKRADAERGRGANGVEGGGGGAFNWSTVSSVSQYSSIRGAGQVRRGQEGSFSGAFKARVDLAIPTGAGGP